jgi:hypothetical protein
MKFQVLLLTLALGLTNYLMAQAINEDRFIDWSGSGTTAFNQVNDQSVDINSFKNENNSWNDAYSEAAEALKLRGGGVIYFPKGMYEFNSTLYLSTGIVLRGEGSKNTQIQFDLAGSGNCIQASGGDQKVSYTISEIGNRNENWFTSADASNVSKGDWIRIIQGDSNLIYSSWSKNYIGQISQVTNIIDDKVFINSPLSLKYSKTQGLIFKKLNVVERVGIEDLEIVRNDKSSSQTNNISFTYVVNSWIGGVASKNCNFSHVTLAKSANNLITGCHFKDGFDYGGGGKAYGVAVQFASTQNRITNNVFDHLRHSMLLQACANGNVFGYNYSINPFWTGVFAPKKTAGDIVLHGNYVYSNLFEGNIAQNLVIDDSHGVNGPFNTFFRNRLAYAGIFMNPGQPSDGQNIIANELTHEGKDYYLSVPFNLGMYALAGKDHYELGNIQHGKVIGDDAKNLKPSLYLEVLPEYWGSTSYPAIGQSNFFNIHTIPAEQRLNRRKIKTLRFRIPKEFGEIRLMDTRIIQNPVKGVISIQVFNETTQGILSLERSEDNKTFVPVANTNSDLNAHGISEYVLIDEDPKEGNMFYRIVRQDDYQSMISDTMTVSFGKKNEVITKINGKVLSIDDVNSTDQWDSLTIYGLNGQVIHAQKLNNEREIFIPKLPNSGMVIIELTNENLQQKVIKQLLH